MNLLAPRSLEHSDVVPRHVSGRIVRRDDLDDDTRDGMFRLLSTHFTGTDRATFQADLGEKSCAIIIEDEAGMLRGFSTMVVYESAATGVAVVYSGDTIVDRTAWGSPALPRTWLRAVHELAGRCPSRELYWLLLTSGFRTYRFLPVFFRKFAPRVDGDEPELRMLLDALACERFAERYCPQTGIVRFARPQVLVGELLALPDGRALDPHIGFFLNKNSGHVRGDELACVARVHESNFTAAGRRVAR
jgi:hypothetical protein